MKKVNLIEAKEGNEVNNLAMDAATLQAEIDKRTESLQKCLRELEEKKELSKAPFLYPFFAAVWHFSAAQKALYKKGMRLHPFFF